MSTVSTVYKAMLPPSLMLFLTVQDSSIGDIVSHYLVSQTFDFSVTMATMTTRATMTTMTA